MGFERYKKRRSKNRNALTDAQGTPFIYPAYVLTPKEYRKICSEINSIYDALYKGKPICVHLSFGIDGRAYIYWFENRGFDDYNIFMRIPDEH